MLGKRERERLEDRQKIIQKEYNFEEHIQRYLPYIEDIFLLQDYKLLLSRSDKIQSTIKQNEFSIHSQQCKRGDHSAMEEEQQFILVI